jgi:hypothetical protein
MHWFVCHCVFAILIVLRSSVCGAVSMCKHMACVRI